MFDEDKEGVILQDPHRPDLYNLFTSRNDPLLNNFEEHLLLMNLGNIDWRPLLNPWAVLEYLTRYNAKSGKGSRSIGIVLEEVVKRLLDWEPEDGLKDLWKTTIMKFYSKLIGGRDYTLFEVVHFGLRLPGVVSSFGNIESVSVSGWSTVRSRRAMKKLEISDRATYWHKLEKFDKRQELTFGDRN